ncbi:hypothetical protein STSP2_00344 [Anaerohalosphaera lusitana]|uniref:Cardiolipin synthase N-terminal domain-containing protein n=1 Tax=Anaerohalosphaera lusitana TaxID=1936003 RepID=A0A1U9NGZ0_9BACT|nr:PLD nuclease N-terminal domain-containing protein [Anaerohalosphaera lusitana]AQT67201.1 hypothetical protein STSP2_00344 [Anaerohalosphaera lusitana]
MRYEWIALLIIVAGSLFCGFAQADVSGPDAEFNAPMRVQFDHRQGPVMKRNIFCGLPCCFLPIGLIALVLWIWALVDCVTKEPSEGNDKIVWVLVIVLTNWLGALIYLLVRRPQRKREIGE